MIALPTPAEYARLPFAQRRAQLLRLRRLEVAWAERERPNPERRE